MKDEPRLAAHHDNVSRAQFEPLRGVTALQAAVTETATIA
jgi:hypothetical protein